LYTSTDAEVTAARTGLAAADISACSKLSLLGPGVPELSAALSASERPPRPRELATLAGAGGAFACRLADDHLLLLGRSPKAPLAERITGLGGLDKVVQIDATTAYAGLLLLGPKLQAVVSGLTSLEPPPAESGCAETGFAGVPALVVWPPRGQFPALLIYVGWDLAEYVWECLFHAGRSHSIAPIGYEALERLGLGG
jgi:glycine cleavage system aminomethyltransferase T